MDGLVGEYLAVVELLGMVAVLLVVVAFETDAVLGAATDLFLLLGNLRGVFGLDGLGDNFIVRGPFRNECPYLIADKAYARHDEGETRQQYEHLELTFGPWSHERDDSSKIAHEWGDVHAMAGGSCQLWGVENGG